MSLLDCESLESALASFADRHDTTPQTLIDFLKIVDLDEVYEIGRTPYDAQDALVSLLESHIGPAKSVFDTVCWFHLTRVKRDVPFSEGILPLGSMIDRVWEMLLSIPKDPAVTANLRKLRSSSSPSYMYKVKTGTTVNAGPFAVLVREVAFHADSLGEHDYFRTPEIIQDICMWYEETFGADILSEILTELHPCIVKFELPESDENSVVRYALRYCCLKIHGLSLDRGIIQNHQGDGIPVPHEAIRKIEFVKAQFTSAFH